MVGSDDDAAAPATAEIQRITKGIQDAVKQHYQESGDAESLTVNNIRSRAEDNLKLEKNYLRTDPYWRNESKTIIREEFERQNDAIEEAVSSPPPPPSKREVPKAKKAAPVKQKAKEAEHSDESEPSKTPARSRAGKQKTGRAKAVTPDVDKELSEDEDEPPTSRKRPRTKANAVAGKSATKSSQTITPDSGASDIEVVDSPPVQGKDNSGEQDDEETEQKTGVDSESEMSEVLDMTPKKKRKRTAGSSKPKPISKAAPTKKTATGRRKKSKEAAPVDADTEKIKELQGWLVKCGVRKLWGKELAKFSSAKEKINHLKGMLSDIGMPGRYSNERAKKIKEERELAADLEAVQQGAKVWGAESGETMKTRSARASEAPAKTRKLVRPPELAFLDDQSEGSD